MSLVFAFRAGERLSEPHAEGETGVHTGENNNMTAVVAVKKRKKMTCRRGPTLKVKYIHWLWVGAYEIIGERWTRVTQASARSQRLPALVPQQENVLPGRTAYAKNLAVLV